MPNSYEHSYQHNLDDVIDASDAVLAIGTEKVDTTTLKDKSLTGNDATIHGAMPSNGYFLGRRLDGDDDYLDCGNIGNMDDFTVLSIFKISSNNGALIQSYNYSTGSARNWGLRHSDGWVGEFRLVNADPQYSVAFNTPSFNVLYNFVFTRENENIYSYVNGEILNTTNAASGTIDVGKETFIGLHKYSTSSKYVNGNILLTIIYNYALSEIKIKQIFNAFARLPLYSHNFERYPNSDTSLTSVFPYTSGIITSNSFNKTDGLKCTSAGQIIFSNSFEFDGSEYITLTIDGVEYSGTTTVTQGTITATIAQGSNDITIDMGTNDVLEDVRVQFREEV